MSADVDQTQTLYFLRHAETVTGGKRFIGSTDVDLSDAGKAAAARLVTDWHGRTPQVIFTSAMLRARLSAEALSGKLGLRPKVDARLNEMDFGEWEGLSWGEIERSSGELARRWSEDWVVQHAPAGESLTVVHHRSCEALCEILNENSNCRVILVVAHAGSIRAMICELLGRPLRTAFDFPLDYLHRFELRKTSNTRWRLLASNTGFPAR